MVGAPQLRSSAANAQVRRFRRTVLPDRDAAVTWTADRPSRSKTDVASQPDAVLGRCAEALATFGLEAHRRDADKLQPPADAILPGRTAVGRERTVRR